MLELETETALEETLLTDDLELDRLLRLELDRLLRLELDRLLLRLELANEELATTAEELLSTTDELLTEDWLLAGGITITLDTALELGAASEAATAELKARLTLLLAREASDDATLELAGATEA